MRHRSAPSRAASERPGRPLGGTTFDGVAGAGFALLWLSVGERLVAQTELGLLVALLCAALPIGYLLADLISGCVHWFADTFFEEETPLIGRLLIEPFRDHHRDPQGIARHGLLEVCGNNCAACVPVLLALWWLPAQSLAGAALHVLLLSLTGFVFLTNLFHRWAHAERVPPGIRWMQRARLLLPPEAHAVHHSGANDRAFCVTSGWLNGPIDRGRIFERATRRLRNARSSP